jgi:large subunit ribosomal protein L29
MKASELRELTSEELADKERDLAQQLFTLRLQQVTGQLENPAKVRLARRDLARVLTVMREQRTAADEAAGGQAK